jgi:predicted nucleic acid-binding protein
MGNRKKCLVDTSVIIALFRKNEDAKIALDSLIQENAYICDITILEILAGCFTVERREQAMKFLDVFGHLKNSEPVSEKAIQLMKRHCIQRLGQPQLLLPDCLIASYAISYKMELLTFNRKDFDFIQGIDIHVMSK